MSAQTAIDELSGKTAPGSITPPYHASVLQEVLDESKRVNIVSILVMGGGTLNTPTTSDSSNFVPLQTGPNSLAPPVAGYDSLVLGVTGFAEVVNNLGAEADFKLTFSGIITSDSTGNFDHFFLRMVDDQNSVYTGTTKRYAAGASSGPVTSDIGFTLVGYGKLTPSSSVRLEVSKNFAGTCVLEEVIVSVEIISPN